jgi:hypothetical protein
VASQHPTSNTSGQRTILVVQFILQTSRISVIMCGQCVLATLWGVRLFYHIGFRKSLRFPLTSFVKAIERCTTRCQRTNVLHAWLCSATVQLCCCEVFSVTYRDRWAASGHTALPPCSPNLNPLNFYMWGHLNALLYAAPVNNREAFQRIVDACQTIPNCPDIYERMQPN